MLKIPMLKNSKVMIIIALIVNISVIGTVQSEDLKEHIHSADAILEQSFDYDQQTNVKSLTFTTQNSSLVFLLKKNNDIFSDTYTLREDIEIYRGELEDNDKSWARFTRHDGQVTGAFYDGENLFLVKKYSESHKSLDSSSVRGTKSNAFFTDKSATIIINAKDIASNGSCSVHDDQLFDDQLRTEHPQDFDYHTYIEEIRNMMDGVPSKQIKINLFADVEFVESSSDAVAEMLNHLNVVDGIFSEQVGVQLLLTDATALKTNETLTSTNPTSLIVAFRNTGFDNPGVSHLFTGKNLNGSTVGIAYVGSLCRNSSVGLTQKYGSKTAIIFAHELGHNFGAPHDNESGSSCSSTSSGFIMNPNVNNSGDNFSNCSVEKMQPVIEAAASGSNACIADITAIAPVITSIPNLIGTIDTSYQYDGNSTVDVEGTDPFEYTLDISPLGMSINSTGTITWTPTIEDIGINTVQLRVSNEAGTDVQIFEIVVEAPIITNSPELVNFEEVTISSFDFGKRDIYGTTEVADSKYQLELTGNNWKSIPINYNVTSKTFIRFDFSSAIKGEIHGIAFVKDGELKQDNVFNVFGSQKYGQGSVKYDGSGETQSILISVGEYFQGQIDDLVFIMDNDIENSKSNSKFSNVIIFEEGQELPPPPTQESFLDLSKLLITDHMPGEQDLVGTVELIEEGMGIKLVGNKWQKVILESTSITAQTIIEFEFKTGALGEIHGLGFYEGNVINKEKTIQLAGVQEYGLISYEYKGQGEWEKFSVPVGQFLSSSQVELVFIMDNDYGSGTKRKAVSSFRNIRFIQ